MKTILLSVLLAVATFGYSQASFLTPSDTVCVSTDHYKIILSYAYRGKVCDSLIIAYDKEIEILEEIIESKDSQINLLQRAINSQSVEIDKLRNQRQGLLVTSGILGITVVFLAIFK